MAELVSFKPGDKIFQEEPWLHTIKSSEINLRCYYCLDSLTELDEQRKQRPRMRNNQCGGCKMAKYCSKKCQAKDWKDTHKLICPALPRLGAAMAEMGEREVSDEMLFLLKIVAKITLRPAEKADLFAAISEPRKIVHDVEHTAALIGSPERMEILMTIRDMLGDVLELHPGQMKHLPPKEFHQLYTQTRQRMLLIVRNGGQRIGSGVYLRGANIPHSCVPNACQTFRGMQLTIVALEDIKSIEDVRVAYVNEHEPLAIRQEKLLRQHMYACRCAACLDPKKDAERFCLRCVNPDCDAKIPFDERASLPCPKCQKKPKNDRVAEFEKLYAPTNTMPHPWMWSAAQDHSRYGQRKYEEMEKKWTALLHPTNPLWPAFFVRKAVWLRNMGVEGSSACHHLHALNLYKPLLSPIDPRIGICTFFAFQKHPVDLREQLALMALAKNALELAFGEEDDWAVEASRRVRVVNEALVKAGVVLDD